MSTVSETTTTESKLYVPDACKLAVTPVSLLFDTACQMAESFRASANTTTIEVELEAKFGTYDINTGYFTPGVSESLFSAIHAALASCNRWHTPAVEQTVVDYSFVVEPKIPLRTRVSSMSTSSSPQTTTVDTVHKCTIDRHTYILQPTMEQQHTIEPLGIRVSLCTEEHPHPDKLPEVVRPTLVRIKQKWTYLYKTWMFELSKVYTGKTYSDAERLVSAKTPSSFEVEIECTDVVATRQLHPHSAYASLSLLLKCMDLIPYQPNEYLLMPNEKK